MKCAANCSLPILTDVHEASQVAEVASVVDVLQTPAFLCRQTDFIRAVAQSGKPVNIKKGQFLAPWDMKNVIDKARAAAKEVGLSEDRFLACERGVSFGYNNLVADMTSLAEMRNSGAPVVFDVTHSVQKPGGLGAVSGGARDMVPVLARAGVAVGVAGLFMETHPKPAEAWSDGPNAVPLKHMKALLETLVALDDVTKKSRIPRKQLWSLRDMPVAYVIANRARHQPHAVRGVQGRVVHRRPSRPTAPSICVRGGKVEVMEGDWNPAAHGDAAQVPEL
jgi:3-deoxy-8-phosphooctulonate synthase